MDAASVWVKASDLQRIKSQLNETSESSMAWHSGAWALVGLGVSVGIAAITLERSLVLGIVSVTSLLTALLLALSAFRISGRHRTVRQEIVDELSAVEDSDPRNEVASPTR
jgi:hypothetical protein